MAAWTGRAGEAASRRQLIGIWRRPRLGAACSRPRWHSCSLGQMSFSRRCVTSQLGRKVVSIAGRVSEIAPAASRRLRTFGRSADGLLRVPVPLGPGRTFPASRPASRGPRSRRRVAVEMLAHQPSTRGRVFADQPLRSHALGQLGAAENSAKAAAHRSGTDSTSSLLPGASDPSRRCRRSATSVSKRCPVQHAVLRSASRRPLPWLADGPRHRRAVLGPDAPVLGSAGRIICSIRADDLRACDQLRCFSVSGPETRGPGGNVASPGSTASRWRCTRQAIRLAGSRVGPSSVSAGCNAVVLNATPIRPRDARCAGGAMAGARARAAGRNVRTAARIRSRPAGSIGDCALAAACRRPARSTAVLDLVETAPGRARSGALLHHTGVHAGIGSATLPAVQIPSALDLLPKTGNPAAGSTSPAALATAR